MRLLSWGPRCLAQPMARCTCPDMCAAQAPVPAAATVESSAAACSPAHIATDLLLACDIQCRVRATVKINIFGWMP